MPDLVKKRKQEEEDKKNQPQAPKPAVVKPAQANKSASTPKNPSSSVTGAMGAYTGGYKVSIHNALGSNANASNESVMKVDMNTLKTTQHAVNVAKQITTDKERDAFLKQYQKHQKKTTGSMTKIDDLRSLVDKSTKSGVYTETVKKSREEEASRRNQLKVLSGLYNADGLPININTASYNQVVQGIRSIADATKRKEAAAMLEEMTKTKGSRFYGQTYDKNITTSYLGNPEFNESDYKEEVSAFADAFYPQSGKDEYNDAQYRSLYEDIKGKQYGKNEERQIIAALDAAYRNTTGKNPPSVQAVKASQTEEDTQTAEDKPNPFEQAWNAVSQLWSGDETTPEEAAEDAPTEESNVGSFMSGEWLMDPEWVEKWKKEHNGEMPKVSDLPGYKGMSASATVSDVKQGVAPAYLTVGSDADVLRAYKAGKLHLVRDEDKAAFLELAKSPTVMQMLGTVADEWRAQSALNGNDAAEQVVHANIAALGTTAYDAYATIMSEAFPDELREDAMMVLLSLGKRADDMLEARTLGGDSMLPALERLLTTDEASMDELNGIYSARDELIAQRNELRTQQEQLTKQALDDAREAVRIGEYSEEQLAMVRANAPKADDGALNDDEMRMIMRAQLDKTYFTGTYTAFHETAIYKNLQSNGAIDTGSYQAALKSQMENILDADTSVAISLGMSLEDYYARMGGMTLDTIANRASMMIEEQGASVTQEEIDTLDQRTEGEGIGVGATVGLGFLNGTNSLYARYSDSIYIGMTEANVIRTAGMMQIKYQQEYGVLGPDMYRADLEELLDSGTVNESYAKVLREAMDKTDDIYAMGIDPTAFEVVRKSGAKAWQNVDMTEDYVSENGTHAEQEAFRVVSDVTRNTEQALIGAGVTAVTGNAKLGFAAAYSIPGFGDSVKQRFDEKYGRESAVFLAAVDTVGNYLANQSTFENILGRMTGAKDVFGNAMSWIKSANPTGAVKAMAATKKYAFGESLKAGAVALTKNIFDEAIGDNTKEGLTQSFIDTSIAPLFRKADKGEEIGAGDLIGALVTGVTKIDYAGVAKDVKDNFVYTALTSSVFAVAGAAGAGSFTYKGIRTAQDISTQAGSLNGYDSVSRAVEIANGRSDDVGGFIEAFKKDLEDDRFISLFNEAVREQSLAHKTAVNLVRGTGNEERIKLITAKQEQIRSHEAKANANQTAIDTAVRNMTIAQEKIDNGTGDDTDVQVVIDSAEAIAKNKTGLDEAKREALQKKDEVKALQDEVMQEARAKANRQQQDEETRARAALLNSREAALADVDTQLEAVNAEIEDALASFHDAMQMGMDSDTLDALGERLVELENRKAELLGETDNANTDAGTENGTQAQPETQDTEEEQKALEAENQRVMAQQEADDMKPVYSTLASTRVYVDDSQRANILARTGLKTLGQVSRKYGLRLTSDKGKATVSLDGSFFKDIAQMSSGRIDENAAHPEDALMDLVERKKQLKGMQASVGETAYEKYLPDGAFYATQDPVMQKTASQIYKRTGIEVVVAPLANNVRALYDRANNRIVMSNRIGAGEAARKAAMHELTHYIEGSTGYDAYRKAVLAAAYRNDTDGNLRAEDESRIQETYGNAGIELDEYGVEKELVADATEKIINDPDGRIVQEILDSGDIGVIARLKMKLQAFLARHKAKKDGTVDAYDAMRKAQQKLSEALKAAGKRGADPNAETDATIDLETTGRKRGEMAYGAEGEQVQFSIVQDESNWPMVKADRKLNLSEKPAKWNDEIQKQIQNTIRKDGDVAIKTLDGEVVHITKDSQWHAGSWPKNFSQEKYRVKVNASAHLDEVSAVSYDQHPGKANSPDDGRHTEVSPEGWRYRTAIYEDYDGQRYEIGFSVGDDGNVKTVYNIGKVNPVFAQKEKNPNSVAGSGAGASSLGTSPAINTGMSSGDDISVAEAPTDVNTQSTQNSVQYALAPNQFANETIQRMSTFSEETKARLAGRTHEVVPNAERMDAAWQAVRERGRDAVMDELLDKPVGEWTPQDHVNAALCSVLAEDAGDLNASVKMAMKYDEAGTSAGQTLQARKIIQRMTPAGTLAETIRSANRKNAGKGIPANSFPVGSEQMKMPIDTTDENGTTKRTPEKVMEVYSEADTLMNQIRELPTDVSYDNPWGLPLTEGKMTLIREYKLEGEKLPGTGYNTATTKQRMLAAVLAADDADLGTVAQQLAAMKRGYSVVTEADMRYIASQISEFKAIEGANATEAMTQAGKNALGRAWQAQDNVNIAGFMTKWSSIRFDNMLSAPATWTRNIMSNVINHGLERTSTRIAAGIDKSVAKKTGTRTTDVATREERKAGKEAFSREIAQTVTDYFVTHTDTGHGRKYGPGHTGRVFKHDFAEAYRNIVDFAMQIGDRPFYERCYTEELAIIRRLGMKKTVMEDGARVTRTMTEEEMKAEATVRATQRVFQEDQLIVDAINRIKGESPTADLVLSTIVPFVKTPTNIAMRAIDYSPVGLAITAARRGLGGIDTGKSFSISQRDYVMNMGRGMTGTGLYMIGWALAAAGLIRFGRGDEEKKERRDVRATLLEPYGIYLCIGDSMHEIDWALPMSAMIAAGAEFYKALEDGSGIASAFFGSVFAGVGEQLLDTPMLSAPRDIFMGYSDTVDIGTRFLSTGAQSLLSQTFVPGFLRAIAKYTDPYVRDTSDSNPVWAALKKNVVQYLPVIRGLLPVATDLTGDKMLQSGYWGFGKEHENAALHFLDSFFTPTATIGMKNDEALFELLDLSYRENNTGCLPKALIGKNDYQLDVTSGYAYDLGYRDGKKGVPYSIPLTDDEKRMANQEFASLLFNGSGTTRYTDAKGKLTTVTGLREIMNSREWKNADDAWRVKKVQEKVGEIKLLMMKKLTDQKKKDGEL